MGAGNIHGSNTAGSGLKRTTVSGSRPACRSGTEVFFASGRGDRRNALHACFRDAAPDSWGRALMTRALGGGLTEFDYLTLSDDRTRHGALRFLDDGLEPLSRLSPPVPRLVELERLRTLAHQFERDPDGADEAVLDLAGAAGSLGGARPKASVQGEGQLWIAKFTSRNDRRAVERAEVATLRLAAKCGLRVSEARLELIRSESPVALIRRFDRRGEVRIPYISAQTALDREGAEGGHYTEIADIIRQISSQPADDLLELWRRLIFTILVSNTDDHLKNHGFIYSGRDLWRLSPAFDINPAPTRQSMLQTGILEGESFEASLALALEAARHFDIEREDAERTASRMAAVVNGAWRGGPSGGRCVRRGDRCVCRGVPARSDGARARIGVAETPATAYCSGKSADESWTDRRGWLPGTTRSRRRRGSSLRTRP